MHHERGSETISDGKDLRFAMTYQSSLVLAFCLGGTLSCGAAGLDGGGAGASTGSGASSGTGGSDASGGSGSVYEPPNGNPIEVPAEYLVGLPSTGTGPNCERQARGLTPFEMWSDETMVEMMETYRFQSGHTNFGERTDIVGGGGAEGASGGPFIGSVMSDHDRANEDDDGDGLWSPHEVGRRPGPTRCRNRAQGRHARFTRARWDRIARRQRRAPRASDQSLEECVDGVLQLMPKPERVAICLRHLGGLEQTELAKALNCSVATAKRRVKKAEKRFESLVRRELRG
jgi:hypothetical protein